jgi:undecaprenyl diphosphate synthase
MTEDKYLDQIDKDRIPQHVAIIMDGNGDGQSSGRRTRSRSYCGAERVKEIIERQHVWVSNILTLYTFSSENWNRPL